MYRHPSLRIVAPSGRLLAALILCIALPSAANTRQDREPVVAIHRNWRREALRTMRVASAERLITDPADLAAYKAAGFNTLVVFDVNGYNESGTAWNFKSEEQIRAETGFAREQGLPLVVGLAVQSYTPSLSESTSPQARRKPFLPTAAVAPNGVIPDASDDEIRSRVAMWKKYGDDIVVGVFPWYDDVFYDIVTAERQRHVYGVIKGVARDWYVFGMIGEFGYNASDDDIARLYDPDAFDHLIVLMYPFNVGAAVTGFPLDNVASSDPDGDITRYIDRYFERMTDRFFRHLRGGQLILLVVQAFYYPGEPEGHIPRARDVEIMSVRGSQSLRMIPGQERNFSAAYFYWGGAGFVAVGLSQRPDWLDSAAGVNHDLEQRGGRLFEALP